MHSQRSNNESQLIRSGVANKQKFFNLFKNFSIRSAVSVSRIAALVGSQCIRHQIDGVYAQIALRTHEDCIAVRFLRMHGDCAANHIR